MKQILVQPQDFKKSGIEVIKTQATGMERNTATTLGDLIVGDRFYYNGKKKDVWEVVSKLPSTVQSNQRKPDGKFIWKFNESKKRDTQVVFLRHAM